MWLPLMWCVYCRRNIEPRESIKGSPFRVMPMVDPAPPAITKPDPVPPAEPKSVAKVFPLIALPLLALLRLLAPTCRQCQRKTEYAGHAIIDFGNRVRLAFKCHDEIFPIEVAYAELMVRPSRLSKILPTEVP